MQLSAGALLIAALTLFRAAHVSNGQVVVAEDSTYRLPNTTAPRNYAIRIRPNFVNAQYDGQVTIQVVAQTAEVNQIVLHSKDLNLIAVTVSYNNINVLESISTDILYDLLILNLNTEMVYNPENEAVYSINIDFTSAFRSDGYGFYRSWYNDGNEIRWMAVTQFAPTYARAAFPCYDEPSYKAVFDVVIERPVAYRSWSNMRIQSSSSLTNDLMQDVFHPTPIMSTYLLAFIVAEYASLEVLNDQGVITYEVIARPDAIISGQGDFAFQIGQEIVAIMNNHTGINYESMDTNIKMTQASVPDFAFSAMENWGLLTYREPYLMYDPAHSSSRFQQFIVYILAHEIAHMWYGNLVTCAWWDALWLNEGFARYYEYQLAHLAEERMGFDVRFITEQIHTSMLADSVSTAHPLTNPRVVTPDSVMAHFSLITYNKGAVVIRMTDHLLGSDVLRQGLQNYLTARSFNTAVPSDLFSALEVVANSTGAIAQYGADFTIDEYYRSWTEKAGYPLLYVEVNHATGDMQIAQRRFDRDVGYSSINANWIVPITFASASNPDFSDTKPTHIIRETIRVINRGTVGDEWVVFNKQQTGFYRVNYDDYTWGLITLALRSSDRTLIHAYNRAQIVDDVFQLARAGIMSYTRALNILSFLEFETDYAPWAAAITGMNWMRRRFAGTTQLASLENTFAGWAANVMSELTYYPIPNESWMRSYLRWQLATVMCGINVAECRAAATAQFNNLRDNGAEVPNDSRSWVYCNALREGTGADWTFLWERFQAHPVYNEKLLLLENLGCTSDPTALTTFLIAITADTFVIRDQDYNTAINSAIVGNEENTQIVFNWIQNNWAQLTNAFSSVATPLSYISSRLLNEQEIQQFEAWALTNQDLLGNSYYSIVNNAQATRQLVAWTAIIAADVSSYLDNGYQAELTTVEPPTEATQAPVTILPPVVEAPITPEDNGAGAAVASAVLTLALTLVVRVF